MPKNHFPVLRLLRSDPLATVLIEVEVPESKCHDFDRNYRMATGEAVERGDYYRVIDNKWSVELRVYLSATDSTVTDLKEHCKVTENTGIRRDVYPYRINDNDLIRWMFREGYRLGPNTPQGL